jgi:hypothetical protein
MPMLHYSTQALWQPSAGGDTDNYLARTLGSNADLNVSIDSKSKPALLRSGSIGIAAH